MASTLARIPLHGRADIESALAAHVDACVRDLRRSPQRQLYAAGVRYDRQDPGERWQLPSETAARGAGDCEDLASWRCAERRLAGESCRVKVVRTGPTVLHAVVENSDGSIEDPSRRLGMGRERVGAMQTGKLTWKIRKVADGWEGEATVPLPSGGAAVTTTARGRTKGDAASRTLRAIEDVTRSPLIASLLPPGAGPAIKAALGVARSVARLFKRKKKARVSGMSGAMPTRAQIESSLRQRGAPAELVRLGGACWG